MGTHNKEKQKKSRQNDELQQSNTMKETIKNEENTNISSKKSERNGKSKMKENVLPLNDEENVIIADELHVNEKFAKAFHERKRKEELSQLEQKYKYLPLDNESESSESETEDEDGEQLTSTIDRDIQTTLGLIRKRDPAIYDSSISFFKNEEQESSENSSDNDNNQVKKTTTRKSSAPIYYKDLVRQQVLAGDADESETEDVIKSYAEEQKDLKQEFLASLAEAEIKNHTSNANQDTSNSESEEDLDGGIFKVRKKTKEELEADDLGFQSFQEKQKQNQKDVEDPTAFLENYLNNEGWKDKSKSYIPHYEDIVNEDEEDLEELEKAEAFENEYNFRFEDPQGSQIQTHARRIEDSMRRDDEIRKKKRAKRKERKEKERQQKEEELRHLKNLKQQEINKKLEKVAKLMGRKDTSGAFLTAEDVDEGFDPESYDKRMQEVFNDEYYAEGDADEMLEKPTWDDEEEKALFGDIVIEDDEEAARAAEDDEEASVESESGDEDAFPDASLDMEIESMTKSDMEKAKAKYLEELYSLDYEDLIGDIKCRFKYKKVRENDFGLTIEEIMAAKDDELKQLVSLKRLAPYREDEYQVNRKRLKNFKKSFNENIASNSNKTKSKVISSKSDDVADEDAISMTNHENKKNESVINNEQSSTKLSRSERKRLKQKQLGQTTLENANTKEVASPDMRTVDSTDAKKSRSRKKKNKSKSGHDQSSAIASRAKAAGLSSSRLESYKLVKASKS